MISATGTISITFFALISFAATLTNTAHGLFVFLKDPRSPVNRLWSLSILCLVWWGCGEVILRATDQIEIAAATNRLSAIGLRLLPAFFLHFAMTFTERERLLRRWWVPLLIYTPAVVFAVFQFTGHLTQVQRFSWGFSAVPADGFLVYILWLETMFAWGLYMCYQKFIAGRFKRERRQALFILLGVLIPLLPSSLIDGILPLIGVQIIRITEVSSTITVVFVTYAVVRYQLMSLTPESSAKTILETIGAMLAVTDPDGKIVFTNESFKDLLGTGNESIDRFHFFDFLDEGREPLLEAYKSTPAGPRSMLSEVKFRGIRGTIFPAILSVSPIVVDGDALGYVHFARDITELKRADEALRQSEVRFRSVWENSADGMRLTDDQGMIVAANGAFCRLIELTEGELVGQPITVTYSGRDDTEEMLHRYRERFEERRIETGIERVITLQSGKILNLEYSHSFIELDYGKAFLLSVFRDITGRKLAEQKIQMLAHTIRSMQECVSITDMQNNIISVNPAFLRTYGYEESEIVGENITLLRSPMNPPGLTEEIIAHTLKGGWTGELLNRRKNGEEFPILMSSSIVRDAGGTPVALVGIARDITERKLLEKQLEESQRMRTEDLQQLAVAVQRGQEDERRRIARELHDDLGQRLSGMKFNIEVFEDTIPRTNGETLDKMRHFKQQIDSMITEIRRLSSNLHPAVLDDFGLVVALELLCGEFQKVQQIKVGFEPQNRNMARFDPDVEIALFRIVQEALANVGKHAGASKVNLSLGMDDGHVRLIIRDDGSGFNPAAVRRSKDSNRGLGLISMRERTQELGGSYRIESTPGKGTTITVEIPVQS